MSSASELQAILQDIYDPTNHALRFTSDAYAPLKTRRAVYGFGSTGAAGTTTSVTDSCYCQVGKLPQSPTSSFGGKGLRLHIRNIDDITNTVQTGAISFTGMWVGQHLFDASGNWTGNTVAAPVQALTSFATAADGSEYVSPWITDPTVLAYFAAGLPFAIHFGFTCAASQPITKGNNGSFAANGAGKSLLAGNASPTGLAAVTATFFDLWLEYDCHVDGNAPALLVIADSLGMGAQATHYSQDSWPEQWARSRGGMAVNASVYGSKSSDWTAGTDHKWTKFGFGTADAPAVDAALICIGSNSAATGSVTAATIESETATIIAKLRTLFGTGLPIYLGTIPPRNFASGTEAVRTPVNTWMRALPWDVAGLADFDRAVRDAPARVDTVAGTTNGSPTVTLPSATAGDVGRAITGTGIPASSYVGAATPGVSVSLSSSPVANTGVNATATATVTATIGGPSTLDPEVTQSDGIHMKTVGYKRMELAVPSPLAAGVTV